MTVSANKGTPPAGLDQALQLIEICKDPKKYEKLLQPLKKSAQDARREWRKIDLAGDVEKLRAEAEQDREKAKQELASAEGKAKERLASLDREYSKKMAALRERENGFSATEKRKRAELKEREQRLDRMSADLAEEAKRLAADKQKLDRDRDQLAQDRLDVDKKYSAIKEAFNG